MDADAIRSHPAFKQRWYYSIELAPGLYTDGVEHKNVALTRELLKYVDVEAGGPGGSGAGCLDIGTEEAVVTMLLERRGGSRIVGYDRVTHDQSFDLIRKALDARFEFVGGMKLSALPDALSVRGHGPFDVVVFSGVLYHMFDPLAGLAIVRGLVRNGGIVVVETRVTFDDAMVMHLNSARRLGGPVAIWLPSVPCLDYLLRFLRLEALDLAYFQRRATPDGPPVGRLAVACRAVTDPLAEAGDEWMRWDFARDFPEFLDWGKVDSGEPPVGYLAPRRQLVRRPGGTIDLAATVRAARPYDPRPERIRLALDAKH